MWAKILAGLLCLTLGFGAGVAWEHRHAMPFPLSLAGPGLAAQRDEQRELAVLNARNSNDWMARAKACEGARQVEHQSQSQAVDQASADADRRGSSAFDSGYAAGRVAGVKSCRGSNETVQPAAPGGAADPIVRPGVVRDDFADTFNAGAYSPG